MPPMRTDSDVQLLVVPGERAEAERIATKAAPIQHDPRTYVCPKCTDSILPTAWCSLCGGSELVTEAEAADYLNPLTGATPYYERESIRASGPVAAICLSIVVGSSLFYALWSWLGWRGVMGLIALGCVVYAGLFRGAARVEADGWKDAA